MTDDREAAREAVIDSIERSVEAYGLSRSAGRVYGVLYFAADPLSIPDLVEETGYAKSTISNVTRTLTRVGLVRRRSSGGGGRRVQFEAATDLWYVVRDVLRQYVAREMATTRRTLDRTLSDLEDAGAGPGTREYDRIRRLSGTYDDVETLLELATQHSVAELIEAIEQYEDGE